MRKRNVKVTRKKMSGKGAALRRSPEAPDYELDTSKNYQLVFVKFNEYQYEFEALQLFEERMNEAVQNGYFPLGAPVWEKSERSEYYMFQGILKQKR